MQPEFKTPEEVAALCRVTRRAVYDWLKEGRLKGYRAGTRWLIKPQDVEAFLGAEPVAPPAPQDPAPQLVSAAPAAPAPPAAARVQQKKRRR